MSKLFHCRCAVAIRFANSDKIIAFDESHIEDVRVSLSGFNTPFGVLQGDRNAQFKGGRYMTRDNTVSVTLNETVLDASWLAMLDIGYTNTGGNGISFAENRGAGLESIYIDTAEIDKTLSVKASEMISDPAFSSDKGRALILEAQGKGNVTPTSGNKEEEKLAKISDSATYKSTLKDLITKAESAKGADLTSIKKQIGVLITAGNKFGYTPDTGSASSQGTKPPKPEQKAPPTQTPKESYGTIVLAMDHSPSGFGSGADGQERQKTDRIAEYLKSEIERKEPKIRVEIVKPERYVSSFTEGGGTDSECGPYDKAWDPYDNYIINSYIKNTKSKATIISVHLDAPKGGSGGSGARVWNLKNATNISNKLTNVIQGTYINKFKEINGQTKESSIGRWNRCDIRSVRIFQNAPEGYALLEFGVFRGIKPEKNGTEKEIKKGVNEFISQQKQAFDALVDGLIQFKRSNGSSTDVPNAADPNTGESNQTNDQSKLLEYRPQAGLLVSFWYDVNNYISKVDYYFILTSASVSFGDGPPRLNLSGVSVLNLVFNTWKIQDSFAAGTPIDEAIRKIFSSDSTKTFDRSKVEITKENPQEKLFEQEDLAGLTYSEFKAKLASKFDLQFLYSPRTDQIGKIKVFREARGGTFTGSQVFWLGRGLFEKFEISVVSELTAFNAASGGNSPYSGSSLPSAQAVPGSPFSPDDRVEFNKVPNQPSMIYRFNGSAYTNQGLPPNGWERAQRSGKGIQVILKLPNGDIWPKRGDFEIHNLGEDRSERRTYSTRSIALWDPSSKTFKIKAGKLHTASDGGLDGGGDLIAYFKGVVVDSFADEGTVILKYNRYVSLTINGKAGEYQLFQKNHHMTERIDKLTNGKPTTVDVGTKIGKQGTIGANGRSEYDNHAHEEFYINTPGNKRLYLDPFIVYNYSYSKDASGNRTFDSAARISTTATGSNILENSYAQGSSTQVNEQFLLKTEFAGIPRALQILPGQTFLNFVTDYNTYLSAPKDSRVNIDPGIPIIRQLKDWMIYRCNFNWSGDLRISLDCYRPRNQYPIYVGQNWQSYRKAPGGKGPALDDYYDYMRSIGDLSYLVKDSETGNIVSSLNSKLDSKALIAGSGQGQGNTSPSVTNGKCKYTGNRYANDKAFLDETAGQLSNQGFNKIAIAGILGNISIESSFGKNLLGGPNTCDDPDNKNNVPQSIPVTLPNGTKTSIQKGRCFGIVQWGGNRKVNAINFIKGSNWTLAAHAAYVVKELRENEKICGCEKCPEKGKPIIDLLNNAKDAGDAARIFRLCYERPSKEDTKDRQDQANIIFQGLTCQG